MRRTEREILDTKTIEKIILKADIIRIGLFDGKEPYIEPVHKVRYLRYAHLELRSFTKVNSLNSRSASPCPPYFVLRQARLDNELFESDS